MVHSLGADQEELGMGSRRLIIVCGVPGAGKSTFALHVVDRWGAVSFASEAFADELGAAGRTSSGDLTEQAIVHAYSAMAAAAAAAIATSKLVLTVGSFRDRDQRTRFRDIARSAGASVTTLRICCPIDTATKRIRSRIASGERGPTEKAIQLIDAELNRASDIDVVLANDTSIEHFYRQADNIMEFLVWGSDVDPPAAAAFVERFEEFAAFEFAVTRKLIEPKRSRMAPGTRNEIASGIEQELQRFRVRIRELRNCLLLVLPRPIESNIETTLQEATDKWVKAVDRLGAIA